MCDVQRELLGLIQGVGEMCTLEGIAEHQIKDSRKMSKQTKVYTIQQPTLNRGGNFRGPPQESPIPFW